MTEKQNYSYPELDSASQMEISGGINLRGLIAVIIDYIKSPCPIYVK